MTSQPKTYNNQQLPEDIFDSVDLENTNHRNRKQSKSPLIRQIGKSEFGNIRQEMILKKFFTDIEF